MHRILIFDLDGTLADPKIGIICCINYALKSCSLPEIDESKDNSSLIGPALRDDFKEIVGKDADDYLIETLVTEYRKRYEATGMFENSLYPGIKAMLDELSNGKNEGTKLIIATSKPTVYAKKIVHHFGLTDTFDMILGSEFDGTRSSKEELISYVIEKYHGGNLASYLMIGDRRHDIIGAKQNGIESVGVLYGYGKESEIADSEPTFIVRSVNELHNLLKKQ